MNKECTKCKKVLPATNEFFHKATGRKFNLRPDCKECQNAKAKEYRDNHKEEQRQKNRNWRKENKDYISEYNKKYREENKDKVNVLWKKYYISHKEELYLKTTAYRRANRDRENSWKRKRYSLKKNSIGTFNHSDWLECQKSFDYCCAYCGKKSDKLTREHFYPLNLGGEYTKLNVIPACLSCNTSKQDTLFFEWYPKQDFYSKKREDKILKYLKYKDNTQQIAFL